MSKRKRLTLFIFGFLLEVSAAADSIQIPNSSIAVTSYGDPWKDMIADRVNDGVTHTEGIADSCGCCAALQRPSWVQLTLDKTYLVEKILVLGRTDAIGPAQFNNISLSLGKQNQSLKDEAFTSKNHTVAMAILTPPLEVYAVRISGGMTTNNHTTICEIMIYRQADCLLGKYGVNCSKDCHCLSGPCESVTGTCIPAVCKDGWRGLVCNESCNHGTFGSNCFNMCHCFNNITCSHSDGVCPNKRCAAGWMHDNCSVACNPNTFGSNCSNMCNCLNNVTCNHSDGGCPNNQCEAGWTNDNCSVVCGPGNFGNNCSFPCLCLHGERCDHISGHCPNDQCAPGWTLRNCSAVCGEGLFGNNCSSRCNCLPGASCDHVSGHCSDDQCAPGWTDNNCSVAEVSISTTQCPESHSDALSAVSSVLGVVVAALIAVLVFIVLYIRRIHRQSAGGNRANRESSLNTYDDLSPKSTNPNHYDCLHMPTIEQLGR